jgi:Phospholipase_D-nuclease N-terminal
MLLFYVLFALITIGFVVPCIIDIAMTPRHDFEQPTKHMWLLVVVAFWAFGAVVWLLVGRRDVRMRQMWNDVTSSRAFAQQEALRRHPAGRTADDGYQFADAVLQRQAAAPPVRYLAPDDNPHFLLELDRRIREWRDGV